MYLCVCVYTFYKCVKFYAKFTNILLQAYKYLQIYKIYIKNNLNIL